MQKFLINYKNTTRLILIIISITTLSSCAKTVEELEREKKDVIETKETIINKTEVTSEIIETLETPEITETAETRDISTETSMEEEIEESSSLINGEKEKEEKLFDSEKSKEYSNVSQYKFGSKNIPCTETNLVDLNLWQYGRTPAEWVYVEPNIQLLSNNSPNLSANFGYKKQASSGPKGCYMAAFTECDEVIGTDYNGSLYCFDDYTKTPIEEILFKNSFKDLMYGEYNVLELLKKRYELTEVSKDVCMIGEVYVNIVYVDELDEIIEKEK